MSDVITPAQIEAAVAAIRPQLSQPPQIGLVLGSGLNELADNIENPDIISYENIPHWPVPTVPGHSGRLVIGQLEGKIVLAQQGRAHYYEGYSPAQITMPVRVMRKLGIQTLIVTNAAGGINPNFSPGDLMLIKDHLFLPGMAGHNPLRGPNDESIGPRFPDMTFAYDPELRALARQVADDEGFDIREGVYACVAGPSFETPAELRFLRSVGVDAVGMSTAPTVIAARHAGIRVLGISSITNQANPDPQPGTVITHEEVLETGRIIIPRLTALLRGFLRQI